MNESKLYEGHVMDHVVDWENPFDYEIEVVWTGAVFGMPPKEIGRGKFYSNEIPKYMRMIKNDTGRGNE